MQALHKKLAELNNSVVTVLPDDIPDENGTAAIIIRFSDGTTIKAAYWRLIQDNCTRVSSFDHRQKYGLPVPIDAKEQIARLLTGKICDSAKLNSETADIIIWFYEIIKLEIFNFTRYEIWEIHFPDGTGEYSNYALRP